MIKVTDRLPEKGQEVIAYTESGDYYFAEYNRVLTWRGFKMEFENLIRRGYWLKDGVVGWSPIPPAESSSKSDLVRKACVKAYNLDFDQLREFYRSPEDSYLKNKWHIMQHDFSRWFCELDSVMAEKFMEDL